MLKNKGAVVVVKYNGFEKEIAEGGLLDMRDFDISLGQTASVWELLPKVEKQIIKKYPGQFEVVAHTENVQIDTKYKEEIAKLKAELETTTEKLSAADKANKENAKKISEMAEEINGFGSKETGYKNQISTLKAQLKDMEDDHKVTLKRMTGGK